MSQTTKQGAIQISVEENELIRDRKTIRGAQDPVEAIGVAY